MIIKHKFNIDLVKPGITPKIQVVQGNIYTRMLVITLKSDRRPWRIPQDAVPVIRYRKPDRTSGSYDTLADGSSAIGVNGNTLTILVAPEVLTLAGEASLEVTFLQGQLRLTTFQVEICILPNCSTSLSADTDTDTAWVAGFLPSPDSASAGQHLVVKRVDEAGHVIAIQTEDLPPIGKDAYQLAMEGGFLGTEEEFAVQLAKGGIDEVVISADAPTHAGAKIWIDPSEEETAGSTDSANIDVVAEIGQTIVVKAVDANGKPTAWEAADHQTRTHWTEDVQILPETTGTVDPEIGGWITSYIPLADGAEYVVRYNGEEYLCQCVSPEPGGFMLGNVELALETGDNGIPFFLISYSTNEETLAAVIPIDGSISFTISITEQKSTAIPMAYVSNAFPYYLDVELETVDGELTYNTQDTAMKVKEMLTKGRALIMRVTQQEEGSEYKYLYYYHLTQSAHSFSEGTVLVFTNPAPGTSNHDVLFAFMPNDGTLIISKTI